MKIKLFGFIFLALFCSFLTISASAATITVNTLTDENNTNGAACSLREAINNANGDNTTNGLGCAAGSGTDDIVFSVSGTINLTAVLPDINTSMNIGNNTTTAPNLTVNRSSGGAYRIFLVNGGSTVSMSGIVITNGSTTEFGGGIRNGGTLTLNNCIITNNNTTNEGTGVFSQGSLTVLNTSFLNNTSTAYGGGISHRFGSFLSISNSTFSGNSASVGGGAIDIVDPNVTISNTTFNNNSSGGFGGAITMSANSTLINCTFANNTASSSSSGAIYVYNNITASITNSTFAQNSVGGIGVQSGSLLTLRNTIVAGNTAANLTTPRDITGNVVAGSLNNLIGTGGAGGLTNGVNGNQTNVSFANVRLLPLGSYGGSVQTMPIRTNSPARNAGTNTGAPTTDARGFNRPQATTTDIGAFEIQTNSIVTNTNNSGAGSLRQAVTDITAGDVIQFETPLFDTAQTISLSGGQITLGKNLTIYGNGANILNVQNTAAVSSTSRVFDISSGVTVNLTGMTISGGNAAANGGAINTANSNLVTINGCHITGNRSTNFGGGIFSRGVLNILNSTVSANISTSTSLTGSGSGINNSLGGTLNLTNSTVSGNSATGGDKNGGVWSHSGAITTITNSTITNNISAGSTSAGGLFNDGGSVTVRNSIIAANQNNATVPDVSGAFTSSGFNLVGNRGTATGFNQPTDQTGTNPLFENSDGKSIAPSAVIDPQLAPLALNGGTIPTHTLVGTSPAIDKGNSFGATTDARGLARPIDLAGYTNAAGGDGSDIGAVELQLAPTAANISISGRVSTANGAGLANATVYLTDANGASQIVKTGSFGSYIFADIAAGETYTITVVSKKFQFIPQLITPNESIADINFAAQE